MTFGCEQGFLGQFPQHDWELVCITDRDCSVPAGPFSEFQPQYPRRRNCNRLSLTPREVPEEVIS